MPLNNGITFRWIQNYITEVYYRITIMKHISGNVWMILHLGTVIILLMLLANICWIWRLSHICVFYQPESTGDYTTSTLIELLNVKCSICLQVQLNKETTFTYSVRMIYGFMLAQTTNCQKFCLFFFTNKALDFQVSTF